MNVTQTVERAAKFFPDKAAVIFDERTITYAELNALANRLAHAMDSNGIRRGDRVALYLPNIPEFIVSYLATLKIGALAVSVNPMLKSEELKYILNDCGARLLCTAGDLLPNVRQPDYPELKHVLICEGDAADHPTLDAWLETGDPQGKALDLDSDADAVILYTSGTTGFPKGATLTHGNVISNTWAVAHHAGYTLNDRMSLFLPMFHVFGQNFVMNGTFATCATLVLFRRFEPDNVLAAIQTHRVSIFLAVPTIYIMLLNMDLSAYDLSSIRYDFSAAATMPREISARWTQRFGRPIFEGYGLTECSPFACYNHDFRHKFGSVGTPVENVEVKILDEDDHEVPEGQWGEICIKGPGVMKGYWNRPAETAKALRNGWLHTGDTGTMDDEGYVFIVDRVKDMINAAGFKVWPAEIEQILYHHPAIQELAVYGVPHPVKGEAVRAAVVLKSGAHLTSDEIISYCRENMANYKIPAVVDFVDELPKSATGKILKRVLRDQVSD
jgi:long-chain acyl-CoA synthetase